MRNSTLQLTIRGIDPATKAALVKKATMKGLSLNQFTVQGLRYLAGTNGTPSSGRAERLRAALRDNPFPPGEMDRVMAAIKEHKRLSIKKQQEDEANGVFGT